MTNSQLAAALIAALERRKCVIRTGKGEVNIIYSEGTNLDGSLNTDNPNGYYDLSAIVTFESGEPVLAGAWEATTSPGKYWTEQKWMNPDGPARAALGQHRVHRVGYHRGNHLALIQTGGDILVYRDKNKDYKRDGDKQYKGPFGINQHHGSNSPRSDIGPHSAGCWVRRSVADHSAFMRLVMADPAYHAAKNYTFYSTIIEGKELIGQAPVVVVPSNVRTILKLTHDALRKCFPKAPQPIIDAFMKDQVPLAQAGILDTPQRLAYCFANLAHETGDWTIKNLTENINYTHARVAQVWPNRFSSGDDVARRYGTAAGWQLKMFDDVYGNRMGNRPGTDDGSRFIGRGGPQITGRDGYREIAKRTGLALEDNPELATFPSNQPAIAAAFWSWKKLNELADRGDFIGVVKRWNGGTNGLPDRQTKLARILPITKAMDRISITAILGTVAVVGGTGVVAHQSSLPTWAIVASVLTCVVVIGLLWVLYRTSKEDA